MALILFVEYHVTFRQAASYLMDKSRTSRWWPKAVRWPKDARRWPRAA